MRSREEIEALAVYDDTRTLTLKLLEAVLDVRDQILSWGSGALPSRDAIIGALTQHRYIPDQADAVLDLFRSVEEPKP
jgi:hypothetical protein